MNVAGALLLLLIVVIAGALLWLWYGATISRHIPTSPQSVVGGLKIEAASFIDSTLVIYVRNLGDVPTVVDRVYIRLGGNTVAVYSVGTFTLTVWGGDVWDLSSALPKLVKSGLILYDDFDTLNRDLWIDVSSDEAVNTWLGVEDSYLKIEVSSKAQRRWATYGLFTTRTIDIPKNYVVEVELWKQGDATRYYAVCLYLMSTNKSTNPYYNTPWFAIKLYPRRGVTYAQVVYREERTRFRNLYSWYSGYPHAHIVAMVRNGYVETVLLWDGDRYGDPTRVVTDLDFQAISGDLYIALTVDTTETRVCSGWIGYVKIYRDTAFTLEGLQPGKTYVLRGSSGSCKITPQSTKMVIDPLDPPSGCEWLRDEFYRHGYPIELEIESDVFRVIKPRSVKPIGLKIELPPGVYSVEVVSREGISAMASITIAR